MQRQPAPGFIPPPPAPLPSGSSSTASLLTAITALHRDLEDIELEAAIAASLLPSPPTPTLRQVEEIKKTPTAASSTSTSQRAPSETKERERKETAPITIQDLMAEIKFPVTPEIKILLDAQSPPKLKEMQEMLQDVINYHKVYNSGPTKTEDDLQALLKKPISTLFRDWGVLTDQFKRLFSSWLVEYNSKKPSGLSTYSVTKGWKKVVETENVSVGPSITHTYMVPIL